MGISDVIRGWIKVLKLATKPTWEEYRLTLRVVVVGMSLLGVIGFFFQLAGSMLEFASIQAVPREYALIGGAVVAAAVVLLTVYMRSRSTV